MRILNVNQTDELVGGSDIYWSRLSSLLAEHGHEVFPFYSSNDDPGFPSQIDFKNPNIFDTLKYIYNFESRRWVSNFSGNLDLAHLHIYYGKLTSSILSPLKLKDIPVVQTLHEYKLVCPVYTMHRNGKSCYKCQGNKFYCCLFNRCNRGSLTRSLLSSVESYVSLAFGSQRKIDAFITVSDFQKREICKMGFPEEKLTTIHNFVDYKQHYPKPYVGQYLLYFGRVEKIKGVEQLIRAMQLLREHGDLKLLIAGTGGYLVEAMQLSKDLGVCHSITFLGHCSKEKVNKLLAGCFASVIPSIWAETFGLTVIESFCEERPVIASHIGGMTEIIKDGESGLFVVPGDIGDLANKILYLYQNPGTAERMGKMGRLSAIEHFSPEAHYQKIMQVYKSVS